MATIVRMDTYLARAAAQRGFEPWRKRFGEIFDRRTRLSDMKGTTLLELARPGEGSTNASYELIMGALNLGGPMKFPYLEKKEQMTVVDIHLFLADQFRFEMMRRLGWVKDFSCGRYTLLEMVMAFDTVSTCKREPPTLVASHPDHEAYIRLTRGDRESFVRRLLPDALEAFPAII